MLHYGTRCRQLKLPRSTNQGVQVTIVLPLQYLKRSREATHKVRYTMIRAVLADDEVLARQKLRQLFKEIERR